jgi:hypothetical protein
MAETIQELIEQQQQTVSKLENSSMPRTHDRDLQVDMVRGQLRVLEAIGILADLIERPQAVKGKPKSDVKEPT